MPTILLVLLRLTIGGSASVLKISSHIIYEKNATLSIRKWELTILNNKEMVQIKLDYKLHQCNNTYDAQSTVLMSSVF